MTIVLGLRASEPAAKPESMTGTGCPFNPLFALVSYVVARRTAEFGLRIPHRTQESARRHRRPAESLAGQLPSSPVLGSDLVVALLDIHPWNPGHILRRDSDSKYLPLMGGTRLCRAVYSDAAGMGPR